MNTPATRLTRFMLIGIGAAWICLAGCSGGPITQRSQLRDAADTGPITILLNDGTQYELQHYRLRDSDIAGEGVVTKSALTSTFAGAVRLSDIAYIQTGNAATLKGLIVAGMIVFVASDALVALNQPSPVSVQQTVVAPPPASSSCPFVYSCDGVAWHFESEPFGAAFFRGAERATFDEIDHCAPIDGHVMFKITNERPETDYFNTMRLHVIDAPDDCVVLPDARGAMHTLSHPVAPARCTDLARRDALSAVRDADSIFWESDIRSKSFTQRADVRDGLIATFAKPHGAQRAKLIVAACMTQLAGYAFSRVATLEGPRVLHWYRALETDSAAARTFLAWMERTGTLHVSVWRNGTWSAASILPDMGDARVKEQLGMLDIGDIPGDTVIVKIESTTGLWRIDRVRMDYSDDLPVVVNTLSPAEAKADDGRDITSLLRATDDAYFINIRGGSALVTFPTVPVAPHMRRTYVLESRGYYHPWYQRGAVDLSPVVDYIIASPDAGALLLLNEWQGRPGGRVIGNE